MTAPNPYQPPSSPQRPEPHPYLPDGWVACPQCRSANVQQPGYTWWGGMLGPKLFNHVKCQDCGYAYNAKTGKSNTPAIIIYQVVAFVIVAAIIYALY